MDKVLPKEEAFEGYTLYFPGPCNTVVAQDLLPQLQTWSKGNSLLGILTSSPPGE